MCDTKNCIHPSWNFNRELNESQLNNVAVTDHHISQFFVLNLN